MAATKSLSNESLGYLNYLHATLTQPPQSWEGFYHAQSPSMNFALRYQLAFAAYALATLSQRTPAYRRPYAEGMRAAIERMLDVAVWGYWRAPEPAAGGAGASVSSSGHVAVLISPHQRGPSGPPSDPLVRNNLQYSGHLSTMLGLYEKVTGDRCYDDPFTLRDPEGDVSYTYTHTDVAARIYSQMRDNQFGGVCCEPGMAYVPCNNYSLASNTLHDLLHGTRFSVANPGWLHTVRRKMVLKGPALRGVFGASYVEGLHVATPVAFNFTDAWGLAFLLPFDRPLVKQLYGKFRQKVERAGAEGAFVGSSSMSEKMEISDVPINTGFGAILARGIGDTRLASAFEQYAASHFNAGWEGSRYYFKGAPRTVHATALYALASAIDTGGESFTQLFNEPPIPTDSLDPYLDQLIDDSGRAGVCRAVYNPEERVLRLGLMQVGSPDALKQAGSLEATLLLRNVASDTAVAVSGEKLSRDDYSITDELTLRLPVRIDPAGVTSVALA